MFIPLPSPLSPLTDILQTTRNSIFIDYSIIQKNIQSYPCNLKLQKLKLKLSKFYIIYLNGYLFFYLFGTFEWNISNAKFAITGFENHYRNRAFYTDNISNFQDILQYSKISVFDSITIADKEVAFLGVICNVSDFNAYLIFSRKRTRNNM